MVTIEEAKDVLTKASGLIEELKKSGNYYSSDVDNALCYIEKLEALGLHFGDKITIPSDFKLAKVEKDFHVMNSAYHYSPEVGEWLIHWNNGNVGAYQFVNGDAEYFAVQDEWMEFKNRLLSYDPVDYDMLNCHIVYSVENGKRLMADYLSICRETREKMSQKIKTVRLERAKKEYEKLLQEVKENDA